MYYTYAHCRNDNGLIFYIGKGKGKRAYINVGRSTAWNDIYNSVGHTVEILAEWPTSEEAHSHETLLIACFKDIGYILTNKTNGGEGCAGYKQSSESNAKRSASLKGRGHPCSDATKKLLSNLNKGKQGHIHTPEQKKKISDAKKIYWAQRRVKIDD